MMRSALLMLVVVAGVVVGPRAGAQTRAESPEPAVAPVELPRAVEVEARADAPAEARGGPTMEAAAVAPRAFAGSGHAVEAEAAQQGQFGRAETLMIVGGAAFVAGLLIGDDAGTIVMVGGAVMGLYGLYLYLQAQ